MPLVIYHNPHCSKSRQALALLQERGLQPVIVEYHKHPPPAREIERLLEMLNCEPREIMRRQESAYRERGLDDAALGRAELVQAIIDAPELLQRPIVVNGDRAAIGRPPEKVLEIL